MSAGSYSVGVETMVPRVFWVEWFHRTPHINLTLHSTNSTFQPYSPVYQESLGIIGSVPAAVLILTLLVLLLYLLTRCCDNRPRKPGSILCLKITLVFFAILTLGALGVSIWGNEEVHEGMTDTVQCLDHINSMVYSLSNQTKLFDETIRRHLQPKLNLFKETINTHDIDNQTVEMFIMESLHYMQGNISEVLLINVEDINAMMSGAEMMGLVRMLGLGEMARWLGTHCLTGLLMMLMLVVVIGVILHSRGTLITFSVLGLLVMILCWALTSVYLVTAVALSDWCMDPNPFLESKLSKLVSRDVASYYLHCDPTKPSPFTRYLNHAHQAAELVAGSLARVTQVADEHYDRNKIHPQLDYLSSHLNQSRSVLGGVSSYLECQPMHHQYQVALNATCYQAMTGVVYLLLSAAGSGLLLTMLVWCTSHTWIYLNHKGEAATSEERDPFLPGGRGSRGGTLTSMSGQGYSRPRHSHTPPQTPPFPGTLNGRHLYQGEGSMGGAGGGGGGGGGSSSAPATVSTMGRGENHHHNHHHHSHSHSMGPNQGQYATLSKQCKTLESSDFY